MAADRNPPSALPATLSIGELSAGYRSGRFTVEAVLSHVLERIAQAPERHVWISLLDQARVHQHVQALASKSPDSLPLYGIPFAVKDNIDLEGVLTTVACPDYAYMPERSAHVVQRLIDAGAIPIGKTNLDQFATGLVGTRSPYGACRNSVNQDFVSGGSSSGSAVAVATGLVSFSLGTDTAGSGRVPAGFNNIIGLKPTCGRLSTSGVVPACRSIDCVSVFALTADDAARVCAVAEAYDRTDPYSREPEASARMPDLRAGAFRFGIPRADQLEFFDDADYSRLFFDSVKRLELLGGQCVEVDFAPFRAAAKLLYDGAWIAERYEAVGEFIERKPESVHPITRQLILASSSLSAADAFRSMHRLADAKRAAREAWGDIDVLVTPTTGTIYRIAEIEWEPIRLNANLGFYTNFVNFLDLAAVAVPAGFREDGLPFGITLVGKAWSDEVLLRLADRFHRASVEHAGALGAALPARDAQPASLARARGSVGSQGSTSRPGTGGFIDVAVCGAHMEGLPLNHQLSSRGAVFVRRSRTIPSYRFYALPGGPPHRPGLVRVPSGGASVDVEVWSVPEEHFGSFVAGIPAPLGIGRVDLEDGQQVSGFLCEAHAVEGAREITALGGWRQYLNAK